MKSRSDHILASVTDAIGSTPLVELRRLTAGLNGRLLVKLEFLNPGLSKKDRVALQIIEDAEAAGSLRPGQPVVELTSGNTGTGLALVCRAKGYPFTAVMSKGNSIERACMMRALGAEVVLVDQQPGSEPGRVSGADLDLVEKTAQQLTQERRAFRADQFRLISSARAHELHTVPEILEQSDGQVDAFCDFIGTGGSFAGCATGFKAYNPQIRCYAIEPAGAEVLAGGVIADESHTIQGGGYSRTDLPLLQREQIDGFLAVSSEAAMKTARKLAAIEGLFAGYSSGANVAAAMALLRGPCEGKTVVTLLNDSGLKYMSTGLWD